MKTVILTLIAFAGVAGAENTLLVGDGQIDGRKLQPYKLTWRQCNLQDGTWTAGNDLTEELIRIGEDLLRVKQWAQRQDGAASRSTSYFDRHSFAPLRLEHRLTGADGADLGRTEHTIGDTGSHGRVSKSGKARDVDGLATTAMLDGGALGLPLALLEYQSEPLLFAASMIAFDATYKVTATWVGKERFDFGGEKVEAWMVDVEWIHNELGDVYPGGPDASGGRYWVVSNPPEGFPYVPRYKTDTYAVEFVAGTCPESEDAPR